MGLKPDGLGGSGAGNGGDVAPSTRGKIDGSVVTRGNDACRHAQAVKGVLPLDLMLQPCGGILVG